MIIDPLEDRQGAVDQVAFDLAARATALARGMWGTARAFDEMAERGRRAIAAADAFRLAAAGKPYDVVTGHDGVSRVVAL